MRVIQMKPWWSILGLVGLLAAGLGLSAPASGVAGFGDVQTGRFYTDAVQWMVDNDITTGTSPTCFSPDDPVTRGQAAAFMWRMEGEPSAPTHPFTDIVRAYQNDPVSWLYARGITTGTSPSTFSPDRTLDRGEMATLLWRLAGEPTGVPAHPFTDVVAGWQQAAVSWMANTGITTGTSPTTFSPSDTVTRGQLATFFHRYKGRPPVRVDPFSPACGSVPPTTTITTPTAQWLLNGVVGDALRPQAVPTGVWVPLHWGRAYLDTTVGRPQEGSVSADVVTNVTLTPAGPQIIEVAAGDIAAMGLATPGTSRPKYLVIEDTVNLLSQVVRYTGLSPGTGSGGADQITGVSLGSWSLRAGGQFNVRQAAVAMIDPEASNAVATAGGYLLFQEVTVAWEAASAGVRRMRSTTWSPSLGYYPAFQGTDVAGLLTPDGVQVVNDAFQPGWGDGTEAAPLLHVVEVYQSSGGDLETRTGVTGSALPAYTSVFNAWLGQAAPEG